MAYKLTPEQYRDAARRRISNQNTAENTNSAVSAYARAIDPSRGIDNKTVQQSEQTESAVEKNSGTDNWILQLGATVLGDFTIRPLEGVAKFVENSLLDFSAGIIATGLDWVGADSEAESLQDFAAQDFVGDAFDWEPIQAIYDSSFSNEWGKFGDILQQATYSVGQQAIPIALNAVPVVGKTLSKIAFAQGAYGASFEEASQDGGSVTGASLYGAISAGLETLIENMGGPLKWGGKGVSEGLEQTIKNVAKSKAAQQAVKIAFDSVDEGMEEVISGALDNYVKAMTYKADTASVEAYFRNIVETDPATAEELLEQFFVGAMSGAMLGGGTEIAAQNSPTMQFSEASQELQELRDKAYRLNEKGKDTSAVEAQIAEKDAELAQIANKYKYRLQNGFQKNKKGYAEILSYMDTYYEKDAEGNYGASRTALIHHNNVGYGATQAAVEDALRGSGVIHQGELTGKAAEARATVDKAVKNINKSLKGARLSVVYADITQNAGEAKYGYIDKANRVIVVDARYLGTKIDFEASDGAVYKVEAGMSTLLHEVFHDVENTKAGNKLKKELVKYVKKHSKTQLDLSSESKNSLTNDNETQYSKRRTTKYLSDNTIGIMNVHYIRGELNKLYDGITDGIADGIAIEHGNTIYIVDSGKDNGKLDFGVRKMRTIQDSKFRAETVRRINNDAISKGNISDGLSSKFGIGYDNGIGRDLRRESGAELSADTRESADHEKGISGEVRDSRRRITDSVSSDLVSEVKESYPETDGQTFQSELAARQLENLLLNEKVINALTQDNSTLAKRILHNAERLLASLKGENLAETKDLERILNKTIKLYNKAIAQKGKGQTVKPKKRDKKEEKEYSKNKGEVENVKRSDEFRRIQAASLGLSDEDVRMFHRGGRRIDGGVRERLSRVFREELESECRRVGYVKKSLVNQKYNIPFSMYGNVDAETFHDIFNIVHQYLRSGDAVDIHNKEYYRDCKNYLTEDGLGGFSITKDGDLISVFNLGKGGFLSSIRDYLREQGAVSLDCYQSKAQELAKIYEDALGFKTASILDFNYEILEADRGKEYADYFVETYGEAPVHFMVLTDSDVEAKQFSKDDYASAVKYQRSFLNKIEAENNSSGEVRDSRRKINDLNGDLLSDGQENPDTDIRYSRRVTHTQAEIKAATDDMIEMMVVAGDINTDEFDVSTRKNYDLKRITEKINALAAQGKLTENSKPVRQLVDAVIDGTILTEHYAGELREQAVLLDGLRPFLHSMNFQEEGIKAELQHKYGKENNVFRLWGKKTDGRSWESVVQEIAELMPEMKKDSDLETLFNIIDSYARAVADMKRVRYEARSFLANVGSSKGIKPFDPAEYDYKAGLKAVSEMGNVADLEGDEFPLGDDKVYIQVAEFFDSIGNQVYNDLLGNVELTKRGAKDSISHGLGRTKAAAFKAVPEIIQKGYLVDYQTNWKGRGYDTAVISAPVSIEGESYYAAVVVRRTKDNQRFYLHEIDIEKKASRSTKATTAEKDVSSTKELGGSPFINSIFEKIRNVNSLGENFNNELISKLAPRKIDDGLSEIKRLMAKQLIRSLSEQGTELVTKVTADRLSETLKTERKEMQKALRAIKDGDKNVFIGDLALPQSARNQLVELSQSIAKERAVAVSDKVVTALVNDLRGDLTAAEIADLKKNIGFKLLSAYVSERYMQDGRAPSMESVRTAAGALYEALRRDVSDVKRVRDALAHNEKVVKRIRGAGYDGLKNQIRNLTVEDTYIDALDGFFDVFGKLVNADGNMRSFNEIVKKGLLRDSIEAFEKYFQADNPVLADMVSSGEFENIKTAVSEFKGYLDGIKSFKELSFAEREDCLNGLSVFLGAVTRAFSPEAMVTINGKTVSARKYASKAIRTLEASQKRKKNGEKIDPKRGMVASFQKYLYHIVRPNVMIEIIENSQYSDYRELGGLTGAYEDIRTGALIGENKRLDLEEIITEFWNDKKNKVDNRTYLKHLRKTMVNVRHSKGAVEMSKGEAIGLYLTLRQSDGFRHADADNASAKGIYFDLKGSIVNYAYGGEALKFNSQNVVDLENSLTEKDKQFIKVVEKFMNTAAEAKAEIDKYFFGEARLLGEDYYPLLTDETGKDRKLADKVQYYNPMDVVGHLSINQSRMNGVKALRVRNVIDTLTAYAESIGMYYGVAIPIENFRKIYNGKTSNGQSLKDYIDQNVSSQFKTDIEKLLLDIQGAQDIPDGFWEKRRSRFAAFQILFNLKTPFKQMSGILSLAAGLKNSSVGYGFKQTAKVFKRGQAKFDFAEMYKYCPATRVRYADHHATLAEANTEAVTKLMRIGGVGIELVDKWTVWIAWEACKKEVGAVGIRKNDTRLLQKAGKLLNKTLDCIDRFEITERIEFSRSPSIIKRSLAMFGSSAQAMLSQLVKHTFALSQRYYEKKHLPEMISEANSDLQKAEARLAKAQAVYEDAKSNGDNKAVRKAAFELNQAQEEVNEIKELVKELVDREKNIDKEIKREALYTKKTIASVTASLVVAALISKALDNLLGDDEEEKENFLMSVFDETLSSIFGMFPGLGQMYNALELDFGFYEKKSYDVSFWVVDEWQMFADAINGVTGLMDGSGTKTPGRVMRDWLYAIGQWYGIPFRNVYNMTNGFLNVSPTWDYHFNNFFGKGNYAHDLQKAVKAGDSELAETIVGLMLKEDGGAPDTKVVKTIRSLYEQGYTGVIPRSVSSSVAIDGETYDMTTKQQKRFKQLYSQADEKIEKLIGKQSFVNLSSKVQADSIKWIYDYYYQQAKYDLAGIEDDSKKALFGEYIDVETLAVAYSYCNSLEADTDKEGKAITGSRKQKIVKYLNSLNISAAEKYMILGYLGYSPVNQNAKTLITSYARRNGADNATLVEILTACNIAA